MKRQVFKHHWAGWLPVLLANTVYSIFHPFPAADEYPHVVNGEMEEMGYKVSPVLAGKLNVRSPMAMICLLIRIIFFFPHCSNMPQSYFQSFKQKILPAVYTGMTSKETMM